MNGFKAFSQMTMQNPVSPIHRDKKILNKVIGIIKSK